MLVKVAGAYRAKTHYYENQSYATIFEKGISTTQEPALDATRKAAHALLLDLSVDAVRTADPDVLAVAEHMVACVDRRLGLLAPVAALCGVERALRVALRTTFYVPTAGDGGWTTAIWVVSGHPTDSRAFRLDRWDPLRHAVCGADEETYAKLVKLAQSERKNLDLDRRAHFAFAFPDEAWGNEDLAASHAVPPNGPGAKRSYFSFQPLLFAANDVQVIREELQRSGVGTVSGYCVDLAHVLPDADMIALCAEALPALLQKPKYGPLLKTPPRRVAEVLACYRTKEAAAVLAPLASNPVVAPIVLGLFRDAPQLASGVAPTTKGSAAIGRVVERTKGAAAASGRVGPVGKAPSILRDRSWRAKKNEAASSGDELAEIGPLLGLEEERVDRSVTLPPHPRPVRAMTKAEHVAWKKETTEELAKKQVAFADYALHRRGKQYEHLRVPAEDCIWAFNAGALLRGTAQELVREHGFAIIEGFSKRDWIKWLGDWDDGIHYFEALMALVSPRSAPYFARVAARRKRYRAKAHAWLVQNARISAFGLIPAAVGPKGEAREEAEAALLYLAHHGHAEVVREVAKRYGKAPATIIDALLARDPLAISVSAPKPPAFLRASELSAVVLREGGVLDEAARGALVEMLQVSPLDPPYAGLDVVRRACDEASLGTLALELVEQWVLGDAPGRHEWMLFSAVHFPSDAATRRIATLAREWARKNQAKALRACTALAALASDTALLHLAHIAETTRFDALRNQTGEMLVEAAAARGLSVDELADRTVPDVGLDADGSLRLSYGARRFVVSLDELLNPVVTAVGDGGERDTAKTLPRPTKADDAEAAKTARARFDMLKADLDAVADRQRRRLERAMTSGRAWSAADFRTHIVEHPLLVHLARRLVWLATTAGKKATRRTFRVAEDRTFADEGDRSFDLPKEAEVRLAHPARDPELLEAWPRIFGDYEIIQPFEQLGRAVHRAEPRERSAGELTRLAGIRAPAKKVLGVLESRGFRRDSAGFVGAFVREAHTEKGAPVTLHVPVSPAIEMDHLDVESTTGAPSITTRDGSATAFGELDSVGFSELVRDIEALRAE
ncbi:Molybdate metabolism regulator [Labilithrix luteola]|uniref:Molybdate metabolism regulator n=2 Tax=Labilithrix luteola TaxID=1391654 RepID=A0A0K1PJS6_9BACT|nr:Molybdate metabolism regulator [Labilithrix luteola]